MARKAAPHRGRRAKAVRTRSAEAVLILAGAVLTLILYHDITSLYLYNDDFLWLSAARFDMHPGNVLGFRVVGFFRPLINLSFFAQEHLFPGHIALHYAINLFLHGANTILVYMLIAGLFNDRRVAGCAALLFIVTSTHYAGIVWISARTTLVSSFFLLCSLVAVMRSGSSRLAFPCALLCYALALASKETAVAGILLVAALYVYGRWVRRPRVEGRAVIGFGAITAAYMLIRFLSVGRLLQENWWPGLHILRNLAGGLLYQILPWSLMSFLGMGSFLAEPTRAAWPEVLVVPFLLLLVGIAFVARRHRQMALMLSWAILCLIPASLFEFRFFSPAMFTQDRYYYLSSVGVCAAGAMLLIALWDVHRWRRFARVISVVVLLGIVAGEYTQIQKKNARWTTLTRRYRQLVDDAGRQLHDNPDLSVCVVQEPIPSRPYIMHGLRMEQSGWQVSQVMNAEEATRYRPCLYVLVKSENHRVFVSSNRLP